MEEAQLITPQGERIVLPPHIYARVMEMLTVDKPPRPMTREEIQAVIKETRGKYAGEKSMTEALLRMRTAERAKERERDDEIVKRFFSKRPRRAKKTRVRAG